ATGDARTPMRIMMMAAIVNGLLDPLLIFGWGPVPAMGLAGAAWATLGSRVLTLIAAFWVLGPRLKMLDLHLPTPGELWASWRAILSVGLPAALTNVLGPIALGVLTALTAGYGKAAVAALGVGSRLEGLVLIAPMALGAALTPFVGQNWGALRKDRVAEAMLLSRRFVLAWGLGAWAVLVLFGDWVSWAFSDDPAVHTVLHLYFWIVPAGYGAQSLVGVVGATFNAIDQALRSTVLSALRALLLAIPMAVIGGLVAGLAGLFAGIAGSGLITAVIANGWAEALYAGRREDGKDDENDESAPGAVS
ncbi:MAG: hypothetical protein KC431_19070, partial [Myxococcales bacterium]|nr:hypothetical protein [Myxococcales bacterium]